MYNIAIFASGNGTNAQRIIEYFNKNQNVKIKLVLSNNADAYVIKRAKNLKVDTFVFSRQQLNETTDIIDLLTLYNINFIVLAGFLLKIPDNILNKYPKRIINIHPALLPKYGGKNMYGIKVHQAVYDAKDKESGITIHYVNNEYDCGQIIFQAKVALHPSDIPETIAEKVHELEYEYFPKVIEDILK